MKFKYIIICLFFVTSIFPAFGKNPPVVSESKPNIVIFMADDFGLGSCGPYGANPDLVRTPAIDRLAASGLTFDDAYVTASVCSPTRYTMLTGRYSWRTRLQFGVINPMDPALIDPGTPTIASFLKENGYRTSHFGKWHLGYKEKTFKNLLGDLSPAPPDLGFDYHFGVPNNFDDTHKVWIENDRVYGIRSDRISAYGKSFYGKPYFGYDAPQRNEVEVMQDCTDRAIAWIDSQDKDKPFFIYYASVAVHHPIMPSERMRGTSNAGAYGDFIHDVDYAVGQLRGALEQRGLLDNTIFIFTSDNGGDIPTDETKPENQAMRAGLDINGGKRGDKHLIYEGGLRVPFIVSWPKSIAAGNRTEAFVTTADLFATLAEVVSGKVPPAKKAAPDSFTFAKVLNNPKAESTRPIGVYRDVHGRKAVRFGDWKYVDNFNARENKPKGDVELYNLAKDPREEKNLAKTNPEIVQRGQQLLKAVLASESTRELKLN